MGMSIEEFENNEGKQPPKRTSCGMSRHDSHLGATEHWKDDEDYAHPAIFRPGICWPYPAQLGTGSAVDTDYNDLDSYYRD